MVARLKVFTWSDGFHAYTVAASSRPKALEAWGVDQDLFKTSLAQEVSDDPDSAAALAAPGTIITRGLAVDIGKTTRRNPTKPSAHSLKARKHVEALEARLSALDLEQAEALDAVTARKAALDREISTLDRDHAKARRKLEQALKKARDAAR